MTAVTTSQQLEQELYQEAVALHRAHDYPAAAAKYRALLRSQPDNAHCMHQLGALLVQWHGITRHDEALKLLRAAIQRAPSSARFRRSLGAAHEAAEQWLEAADAYERAAQKQPDDVQAYMALARVCKAAERPGRAAEAYREVIRLQPDHPAAHYKLGSVLKKLGRHEAAADAYRQHLKLNPGHVQASFWLAALTADAGVAACPPQLVADLFNGYSDHFDAHLLHKLHYRTPAMLMDCILRAAAAAGCSSITSYASSSSLASLTDINGSSDSDSGSGSSCSTLACGHHNQQQQPAWSRCIDLGCGTGLMGPLLRPHVRQHLSGIDLSSGMLDKARERGCYDELAVAELVEHLTAAAEAVAAQGAEPFDLLVAADVFVYLGDFPALRAAAAAATDRAVFAFSTELLRQPAASADGRQQPGFRLQPTGRYSHTPEFLRRAAEETGWTRVLLLEEAEIRRNGGQPIHGSLCVLQRG